MLFCILGLCGFSLTLSANELVFDPLLTINDSQQGRELVELYFQAENSPDNTFNTITSMNTSGVFDNNVFYTAVYYRILHNIAVAKSDLDAASQSAEKLFEYGQSQQLDWILAEGLTLKGILAARQGESKQAFDYIEQAIVICESIHYERLLARALNTRGILHSRNLDYEASLSDYQKAISLLDDSNQHHFLGRIYSNISVVYSRLKDWRNAIEYNQKAAELLLKDDNISYELLVVLYSNASNLMLQVNDIAAATDFSHKSTVAARQSDNVQLIVNALWTEAELLLQQQQMSQAEPIILECLSLAHEALDPLASKQCLYGLSEVRFSQKNYEQATEYANQLLLDFEDINNQDWLLKTHQLLAQIYQETAQYPEALAHLTTYYEGTQRQLFDTREKQIYELQVKFDAQLQDEKIALLTAENNLKAATLEKKELQEKLWILVFSGLTIGIALLIHRYTSNKKRISTLRSTNKNLYMQSNKDPLTGLYNRRFVNNFVEHKITKTGVEYYSVLILDCDLFKKINDTHGHDAGDEVLMACATRLQNRIRANDVLARWGGEEFLILLALESDELQQHILERFNQVIADTPVEYSGHSLKVTISIGATKPILSSELVQHWQHYLTLADSALYQAKSHGRNCAFIDGAIIEAS